MGATLLQTIFDHHDVLLGGHLQAVILCGSATTPINDDASDIDFILVVNEITFETSMALSKARQSLTIDLGRDISTTVITMDDLTHFHSRYLQLDGKAVQCLIDATDEWILSRDSTLQIPALDSDQLVEFSSHNLYVVRALLIKHLIRSQPVLTISEKIKLAKIGLIVCKMFIQSGDVQSADTVLGFVRKLVSIKRFPQDHADHHVRQTIIDLVGLSPAKQP